MEKALLCLPLLLLPAQRLAVHEILIKLRLPTY